MKKTLLTLSLALAAGSAMAALPTVTVNGEVQDWDGTKNINPSAQTGGNTVEVSNGEITSKAELRGVSGTYEANDSTLSISNVQGVCRAFGGWSTGGVANNNTLIVANSSIQDSGRIRGGGAFTESTGNKVILQGDITVGTGVWVYGGYASMTNAVTTGNELIIDNLNLTGTISGIGNIDVLTFKVDEWKSGTTILSLQNAFENESNVLTLTLDLRECDMSAVNGSMTLLSASDIATVDEIAFNVMGAEGVTLSLGEGGALVASYGTVPEPTTATLSLLALAGLAARRRRK